MDRRRASRPVDAVQPAEIEWDDIRPKNALLQFWNIKRKLSEENKHIVELILSPKWVSFGYIYILEYQDKFYGLLNTFEFERASAALRSYSFLKIPVTESEEKAEQVVNGLFILAERIQSLTDT